MVRHIKAPCSIPAVLPHGPLQEQLHVFDALIENARTIEQNYTTLAEQTTNILRGLMSDEAGDIRGKQPQWEEGPKFVWKNVASPTASDKARSSPVSRAWKNVTAWLRIVRDNRSPFLVGSAKWKLLFYDHPLLVEDPNLKGDAAAFIGWKRCLSETNLDEPKWVESFLEVADEAAART